MTEPKQIDITSPDLSLDQLKALAYDQTLIRDQAQMNLNMLQQELQRRAQAQNGSKIEATKPSSDG